MPSYIFLHLLSQKPEDEANVEPISPEQEEVVEQGNNDGNNEVEEEELSLNNGIKDYTIENDTTPAKKQEESGSVHNNDVVDDLRMFGAARQASHLRGGQGG